MERALMETNKELYIINDDDTLDLNTENDDNVIKLTDNEIYQ